MIQIVKNKSYHDWVLITFNYKEGTQTVTFGEATEVASEGNGSDLDCFPAPRKDIRSYVFSFLCQTMKIRTFSR